MTVAAANTMTDIESIIHQAWENRTQITGDTQGPVRQAVEDVINQLDKGSLRVATHDDHSWTIHEWVKKAILLSFRLNKNVLMENGPDGSGWWDKVPNKFAGWTEEMFSQGGFRAVPGSFVRRGAYIARDAVLMPSFINIGAYVDQGTMIDTWATVGSCAQIGKRCHISGGTGIGGVLEPLQAAPVIIEDDVFIGARSEIAEGVRVCQGAVISMGVFIGASTKIVDRATGEITQGVVPPYAVVVPGSLPAPACTDGKVAPALSCAVIVKRVDAQTRAKTALNDLLRD